jgi:hypothetical protein
MRICNALVLRLGQVVEVFHLLMEFLTDCLLRLFLRNYHVS